MLIFLLRLEVKGQILDETLARVSRRQKKLFNSHEGVIEIKI